MVLNKHKNSRGFLLIEAMVVSAIMLIVFGGLLIGFRYSLDLVNISRAKLSALTVATSQIEYIRSLSYNNVGTVSGVPAGAIPQTSTTSLNNIVFTKKVLVQYVDAPADGTGAADSNGITTDYKRAKVTVSWKYRGVDREIFLVSTIIPRSIETNVGGGTLRVNVFDAAVAPLPGADVRFLNTSGTSTVDVTVSTDATGVALLGGAPAGPNYQVFVTAPGYSTDQTYVATTSLPNPTTRPATVLVANISTLNFFIDRVSTLMATTYSAKTEATTTESFSSAAGIATSTNTEVTGGQLQLTAVSGVYNAAGNAFLASVTPGTLAAWSLITVNKTTPINTAVKISLYTGTSTLTLIPDSILPGNAAGFTGSSIDISGLSAVTYPSLTVGVALGTTNTAITPQVDEIAVWYAPVKTLRPNTALSFRSNKTIGTLADTSPVYKNVFSTTTDASGKRTMGNIEWDAYVVTAAGFDIKEACAANPVVVAPGSTTTLELVVTANTANTIRTTVLKPDGTPLPGASVRLSQGAFNQTVVTGTCGQAFFSSLSSAPDYDLVVTAPGYGAISLLAFDITGDETQIMNY